MRKKFLICCFIILVQIVFCTNVQILADSEGHPDNIVKVAYFDLGNYYQVGKDGTVDSYDSAYLEKISEYTGLQFEYVNCKTWDEAISKMEKHEVDLVGTMQWTQEREKQYEICDASYGYTVAELAAASDSDMVYEDYDRLNGATVGYIGGYVIGDKLKEYEKEQNLSFSFQTFETQKELDQALKDKTIDLVAANAHAISGMIRMKRR